MSKIVWEQFGLKKNPYDSLPLLEGGDLPIKDAFVGRESERRYIDDLLSSEARLCLCISGSVGVGKTSIANFEKFIWKYARTDKPLFSFRREIEANQLMLNKNSFILEIIGSILNEIELIDPNLLQKSEFLKKLSQVVDITQTFGFTSNISSGIPGIIQLGTEVSDTQVIPPVQLTTSSIEKNFRQLLDFITNNKINGIRYQGLIVHVNNFDVVMAENKKRLVQFFAEIRDLLQTNNVYFIFLGPKEFFKDIISVERRVKSIFDQSPIIIKPLSKTELIEALNKRLEILKSATAKKFIKPFEDKVIFELYDMYEGDIRSIMASLKAILTQISDKLPKTLTVDESLLLLGRERYSQIEEKITEEQMKVLIYIANCEGYVTQSEIAHVFNKAQTNVSGYYMRPLAEYNIIEVKESKGKVKFWGLTPHYLSLKKVTQSQKNLRKIYNQISDQLELFK